MSNFCSDHRLPRAGVDPITDPQNAVAFLAALLSAPPTRESFAVLLDHERRGLSVLHLADDPHPDAVFHMADYIIGSARYTNHVGAVILASVRPGEPEDLTDADRWVELTDHLEDFGIDLVEWFVIGRGTSLPRTLVGDAPRWVP
jgi:hypothetical protein